MFYGKIRSLRSLSKSAKIWRQARRHFSRKKKSLPWEEQESVHALLEELRKSLLAKDAEESRQKAALLLHWMEKKAPKGLLEKCLDFVGAILFALVVAVAVRQLWFELYVIPTGSMRPTLKENDLLLVSKTPFGINFPLRTGHLLFSPESVERGTVFVFTGEDMDIPDVDTTYFLLFPGKKQFVKRLIGKPGDRLYFYGGQIYGVDKEGKEILSLRENPCFQSLEYIPFIRFDGKVDISRAPSGAIFNKALFYQMNEAVAKMELAPGNLIRGEMLYPPGNPYAHYSDLWGMGNFAMARMLTSLEMGRLFPDQLRTLPAAPFYLELIHHPSVQKGQLVRDERGQVRPGLRYSASFLPVQHEIAETLAKHMTTARFVVKDGRASRIGTPLNDLYTRYFPALPTVPDGTYEIQNGVASRIYFAGWSRTLPSSHPLYRAVRDNISLFFNLGIEWMTLYSPTKGSPLLPSRYAYFRDGSLYLLGSPIFPKDHPDLFAFFQKEREKEGVSYLPFVDRGAPLDKEGNLDIPFIQRYGLEIPERGYLALGDNHAMSADSRQFGFVPQQNLRGKVSFLFWPLGSRWGTVPQPTYPWITLSNGIVWGSALLITLLYLLYLRRLLRTAS